MKNTIKRIRVRFPGRFLNHSLILTTINNKPDLVEKLEFTGEDKEYIDSMIAGTAPPKTVNFWNSKGMNIKYKRKWFVPPLIKERMRTLSQKYKISMCCLCHSFPVVRCIWK